SGCPHSPSPRSWRDKSPRTFLSWDSGRTFPGSCWGSPFSRPRKPCTSSAASPEQRPPDNPAPRSRKDPTPTPDNDTLPMPSASYAPTKQDRFAFGIWCLQNRGRDPFGDQTRPELPALECIRGLAQRQCYGFEFHDNDIIPFEASAAQRDQILRDVKRAI